MLKRAFDDAFARPVAPLADTGSEHLVVVAGTQICAIRVGELAGLEMDCRITPVPREGHGLLGLSAVRGALVPVFDLGAVLSGSTPGTPHRWVVLYRDTELVGLAFDEWLETRRIAASDVRPSAFPAEHAALSRHAIQIDERIVHVVDLPAVVSTIRQAFRRG
jgi:chemotaxis signal transduction protein